MRPLIVFVANLLLKSFKDGLIFDDDMDKTSIGVLHEVMVQSLLRLLNCVQNFIRPNQLCYKCSRW